MYFQISDDKIIDFCLNYRNFRKAEIKGIKHAYYEVCYIKSQ